MPNYGDKVEYHSRDVGPGPNGEPAGEIWCPALVVDSQAGGLALVYLERNFPGGTGPVLLGNATDVVEGSAVGCWRYPQV